MYAADSVEKTRACTELAKIPSTITGKGIKSGTNKQRTDTTISSAKMFPNKRKLNDKGLVKSSKILIGRKMGVGLMYRAKNPKPFAFKPP